MPAVGSFAVLDLAICAIILLAQWYLRRVRLPRPPVGRFNHSDVVIMTGLLVALPFVYLALPVLVVSIVFAVMFFGTAQLTLGPVIGGRPATAVAGLLVAASALAELTGYSTAVLVVNAVLIATALTGVANLWVQTGMTTAHVAALAAVLFVYDLLATGVGTVTQQFLALVNGHAFAPLLAVTGGDLPIAAGLGDCLMLVVWPLVATKAFGRTAGWLAAVIGVGLVVAVQLAFLAGSGITAMPFLVILGPAIVAQYAVWRRIRGAERRTRELLGSPDATPDTAGRGEQLAAALWVARTSAGAMPGTWLAVHDGAVVGEGPSPGSARRAARLGGFTKVPTVVQV
jgi:hypothetical protein